MYCEFLQLIFSEMKVTTAFNVLCYTGCETVGYQAVETSTDLSNELDSSERYSSRPAAHCRPSFIQAQVCGLIRMTTDLILSLIL